jgi:hypothetical protein
MTATKTGNECVTKKPVARKNAGNNALRQQCRKIRKLIAHADQKDVQARYQIAVHCQDVRAGDGNGNKYGTNAVRKLADELHWSMASVYDYANVAVTWPDEAKFNELVARGQQSGRPLSWSHMVLLATESDEAKREQLVQDCLRNGWSVSDLKRQMEGTHQESEPLSGLDDVIQSFVAQVTSFKQRSHKLGELFTAKVNAVDPADCMYPLLVRPAQLFVHELMGWVPPADLAQPSERHPEQSQSVLDKRALLHLDRLRGDDVKP